MCSPLFGVTLRVTKWPDWAYYPAFLTTPNNVGESPAKWEFLSRQRLGLFVIMPNGRYA